jgi:Arc/MetJ-type ribon-helix-helix transcriptional regulator
VLRHAIKLLEDELDRSLARVNAMRRELEHLRELAAPTRPVDAALYADLPAEVSRPPRLHAVEPIAGENPQ